MTTYPHFSAFTDRQLDAAFKLQSNTKHENRYRAALAMRKLRELYEMVDASRIAQEARYFDDEGEPIDARAAALRAALNRQGGYATTLPSTQVTRRWRNRWPAHWDTDTEEK